MLQKYSIVVCITPLFFEKFIDETKENDELPPSLFNPLLLAKFQILGGGIHATVLYWFIDKSKKNRYLTPPYFSKIFIFQGVK